MVEAVPFTKYSLSASRRRSVLVKGVSKENKSVNKLCFAVDQYTHHRVLLVLRAKQKVSYTSILFVWFAA